MKPLPWSYSALDTFLTCPRLYWEKYIVKEIVEPTSPAQQFGIDVHLAFELRQRDGTPLPPALAQHEEFMKRLANGAGEAPLTERKVALDRAVQPCEFFAGNVWWRGVLDYFRRCNLDQGGYRVTVADYKTGRPHTRHDQLKLFALYSFAEGATLVDTMFYWTQTRDTTRVVYGRAQIPELWGSFAPKLQKYTQAFKEEDFPPKPNGLCKKYCPVIECEHNGRR